MKDRIVLTDNSGKNGIMYCDEGPFYGPIPPANDQHLAVYERLLSAGVVAEPFNPDMPALRQGAFTKAMAYGNRITAQVENQYASVERASFTAQEAEAKAVLAGETLPDDAILPPVAAHKGVSLREYAGQVLQNASAYRKIAVAAIILRRGADDLLSPAHDTPEKLQAAVTALLAQAQGFAGEIGLELSPA